jgi:cobalt/nickel transport protein
MSSRRFLLAGLVLALLVAGVGSYYASTHPDGLEHVAEQTGFLDSAEDSATADSPLADYETRGIDDSRLSGGVAGLVGALVVLVLAGGLALVVRRRGPTAEDERSREQQDA